MADSYSDGTLAFGSQKSALNAVNYIFDTFSIEVDSKVLDSMDENGAPNKQVLIRMKGTGSATLQLPSTTSPAPPLFATFNVFPIGANTASSAESKAFIVKKVGSAFQQDGEKKVNIDFVEKLN